MRKKDDTATDAAPEVSGAELKTLYGKAAKGEVINYGDTKIQSLNDFRRAFASHPDLAALEGRDGEESSVSSTEADAVARAEAAEARVAELEKELADATAAVADLKDAKASAKSSEKTDDKSGTATLASQGK